MVILALLFFVTGFQVWETIQNYTETCGNCEEETCENFKLDLRGSIINGSIEKMNLLLTSTVLRRKVNAYDKTLGYFLIAVLM